LGLLIGFKEFDTAPYIYTIVINNKLKAITLKLDMGLLSHYIQGLLRK